MDNVIGKFILTKNQQTHFPKLRDFNIKAYAYWHDSGELVAVTESKLNDIEINAIKKAVSEFPDTKLDNISIEAMNRVQRGKALLSKLGLTLDEILSLADLLEDIKKNETLRHYKTVKE